MTKPGNLKRMAVAAVCAAVSVGFTACASTPPDPESADDAITAVTSIAFVDADGAKVKAVVVAYDTDLKAGAVDTDSYNVYTYPSMPIVYDSAANNKGPLAADGSDQPFETYPAIATSNGTPGAPTKVYVRSTPEVDPSGNGDEAGKYVIIELNTDYQLGRTVIDWRAGVAAGIEQVSSITKADGGEITSTTAVKGNYVADYEYGDSGKHAATVNVVLDDSLYSIDDISGWKLYTDDIEPAHDGAAPNGKAVQYPDATRLSMVDGGAFAATNAFSEVDGQLHDVNLAYSLFVPADYDPSKKYMLALQIESAGSLGNDPVISLTQSLASVNYASDRVQQLAIDQGYGGLIVVVPQIPTQGRSMRDNLTGNEYVGATWQLLDSLTQEYSVDTDRIYGSGQSMGGMQVLDMAAQRDNYFAGILAVGAQWGNNYDKAAEYEGNTYFTYPVDGQMITNPDWQNWYYSVSDDNILAINMSGDDRATGYWHEVKTLYGDLAGVSFPYATWDPSTASLDEQNAAVQSLVESPNPIGIYWGAMTGGDHTSTWMYALKLQTPYNWLLSQTRQSEDDRGKLDLNGSYAAGEGTTGYNSVTD